MMAHDYELVAMTLISLGFFFVGMSVNATQLGMFRFYPTESALRTYLYSYLNPTELPSVVLPLIANEYYYMPVVEVLSDVLVNTRAITLSGMCSMAIDTPLTNQVVPPGTGLGFVLSFSFEPQVSCRCHNNLCFVSLSQP